MEQQAVIPYGYCHCACGEKTTVTKKPCAGYRIGEPKRFILGHQMRLTNPHSKGEKSHRWKGGKFETRGYVRIRQETHPRANESGYVFEHIAIAERALGRLLPPGAEIHHLNEIKNDNRNSNLIICPSRSYHFLLHARTRALKACGNPRFRKCYGCKRWNDPADMGRWAKTLFVHFLCAKLLNKKRRINARLAKENTQ